MNFNKLKEFGEDGSHAPRKQVHSLFFFNNLKLVENHISIYHNKQREASDNQSLKRVCKRKKNTNKVLTGIIVESSERARGAANGGGTKKNNAIDVECNAIRRSVYFFCFFVFFFSESESEAVSK